MKNSIQAFKVIARIPNESWESRGTTLIASSQEEALESTKQPDYNPFVVKSYSMSASQ